MVEDVIEALKENKTYNFAYSEISVDTRIYIFKMILEAVRQVQLKLGLAMSPRWM